MIRVQPNTFPSRIPVNVNDLPDYDVADYQSMPVEAFGRAYLEAYGLENFNGGTSVQYQGRKERAGLGYDFSSETESTPRQCQGHALQRPNTLEHGSRMSRSHSTAAFERPNTLKHGGRMSRSHSTADVQRPNTLEHGGRISRSNSSTAVQIPASSRYCRSNEHDSGRGRRRSFAGDTSESELSIAIQDSSETANADGRVHDISANRRVISDVTETNDEDFIIPSFEPLAKDSEPASRYLQSASQASRNSQLQESSFPPLVVPPANSQPRPLSDALPKNTMASRLSGKQNKTTKPSSSSPIMARPHCWHACSMMIGASGPSSSSKHSKVATDNRSAAVTTRQHALPAVNSTIGSASDSSQIKPSTADGHPSSSYRSSVSARSSSVHESSCYSVGSSRNRYHSNRNSPFHITPKPC